MKHPHDDRTPDLFDFTKTDQIELAKRCLRWQREALALREENARLRDRLHKLETRSTWPPIKGGAA